MPISRKKACVRCREAKTKCNLGIPRCARCLSRNLECDYAAYTPRSSPYPETPSGFDRARLGEHSAFNADQPELESESTPVGSAHLAYGQQFGFDMASTQNLVGCSLASFDIFPGNSESGNVRCFLGSASSPESVNPLLDLGSGLNMTSACSGTSLTMPENFLAPPIGNRPSTSKPLAKRHPITPHAIFATKIMLGQIESYPRMMVNGLTLPPFIHSRCSLEDGISQTCSSKQAHQCLPKILSICASLVQLFYSKTPESSSFVWKTIYAEQTRLCQEHASYDHETTLEALQAICIYIILQILDPTSLESNDVNSMIETLGVVGARLHTISHYLEDYSQLKGRNIRYSWMILESTRRTVCLLYIIETLLDVFIGKRDRLGCHGFAVTPLPCGGRLWETASTSEWARGYHEMISNRKLDRPLMVQDLWSSFKSIGSYPDKMNKNEDVVTDILSWCGNLDQFGTNVWMAGTLANATT